MRFIHIADIHLGADPYIGSSRKEKREKEIWTSLERVLEVCESKHVEMLLIAGDLFHRQPLRRELKELDYLFSKLTMTEVVIIAGNHDYLKRDSYYQTFQWSKNVHMILDREIQCVEFPAYSLAIYGMSYDTKQITEKCYCDAFAQRRQPYEILLAHGGDDSHIPIKKENLLGLGYDYIAMGHIHKPQIICPDKIAYAGALEPIDKNDTGAHGYIYGEITTKGCRIRFVPFAMRSYIHQTIEVNPSMTEHELKETVAKVIDEKGKENIYKITYSITDMMNKVLEGLMSKIKESADSSDSDDSVDLSSALADAKITVKDMNMTCVYKNVDSAADFEIPEEALKAQELTSDLLDDEE